MIYPRKFFADTLTGRRLPFIFKCDKPGCYFTIGVVDRVRGRGKQWRHGIDGTCPLKGPTYENRVRVS